MSSENQYSAQQDSAPRDPHSEVNGWWLFLVAGGQIAGVIMLIKLLAQAFGLPGDKLLYAPAIATLALVAGTLDPRTFRHLALSSAVCVILALLAFVATLAVILILSPSYRTVVVIVAAGLLGGAARVAAPAIHRRLGISLRSRPFKPADESRPDGDTS